MDLVNTKPPTGVRSLRNPQRWMVPPWSPTANAPDLVGHFQRFALHGDATDLERLAYYEAYLAALEVSHEFSVGTPWWSPLAERWYRDLHSASSRCLESYRLRCKENENAGGPVS